jgi:transposase
MDTQLVKSYLRFQEFPARAKTSERDSKLKPFLNYLHQRFAEGCQNAAQLWREIVGQGYQGKSAMVRRYIKNLRKRISQVESKDYQNKQLETSFATPSIRQTAILLLNKEGKLKEEEKIFVETILTRSKEIKKISQIGIEFQTMIKEKQSEKFNSWLESSKNCGVKELSGFAYGLKQDEAAVRQSMISEWSNGQVEGQVNRLKFIKRQMYGRANFDLLKARVLYQN